MSSHPLNLAIRFLLELTALLALGVWGWNQGEGWTRFLLGLGIPLAAAVIWGVFNVPDDPSRSGKAPIPVPGAVRLTIELALFAVAAWALFDLGMTAWGWIFGLIVIIHYIASYDRIRWLLSQKGKTNDHA